MSYRHRPGWHLSLWLPYRLAANWAFLGVFKSSPNALRMKLVVEVDGSQHKQTKHKKKDKVRDGYLSSKGIEVLRFNANEVVREIDSVTQRIYEIVKERLRD